MTKVYLAHPFKFRDVGNALQKQLERLGFDVINPFERGEQTIYDQAMAGDGLTEEHCKTIVEGDLAKIDDADGVVAILLGDVSIGTLMEIFYTGYVKKRPVFALVKEDWKAEHPWIRYFCKVYRDIDKLQAALQIWVVARGK